MQLTIAFLDAYGFCLHSIHICIFDIVWEYVCLCVCVCVCIHISEYTHTHTHTHRELSFFNRMIMRRQKRQNFLLWTSVYRRGNFFRLVIIIMWIHMHFIIYVYINVDGQLLKHEPTHTQYVSLTFCVTNYLIFSIIHQGCGSW